MANPSKNKGTKAETRVVNYLKAAGIEAARQPLSGHKDIGDIWYINALGTHGKPLKEILEVKAGKQTANYSRSDREGWLQQTVTEGQNAGSDSYLVIAKHGRAVADYEVWCTTGASWLQFWHLDEFVRMKGGTPQTFKGGKPVEEH